MRTTVGTAFLAKAARRGIAFLDADAIFGAVKATGADAAHAATAVIATLFAGTVGSTDFANIDFRILFGLYIADPTGRTGTAGATSDAHTGLGIALLTGVTVTLVITGGQSHIQTTGGTRIGAAGHGCIRLQRVHTLRNAVDAEPFPIIVGTLLAGRTHAATTTAAIITTLLDLALAIDTAGDTGLTGEGCRITVRHRLVTGVCRRTLTTATAAAIITAQHGLSFLSNATGLTRNALEGQGIATLTFKTFATTGAPVTGDATLLAIA